MDASSDGLSGPSISLLQAMCNATDAVVFAVDDSGLVVAFNGGAERLFERVASDVVGASPGSLFAEGADPASRAINWLSIPGHHQAIVRLGDSIGPSVDVSVAESPVGVQSVFVATVHPGETLAVGSRQSASVDSPTRSFLAGLLDAVAIVRDGVRVFVNQAYVDLFGYVSSDEALADERHGRWHPADAAARDAKPTAVGPVTPHRIIKPDGDVRLVEGLRSELMFEGAMVAVVVLRDVTHRERAIRSITGSEAHAGPILEHIPVGMAIVDRLRRIVQANPALAAMLNSTQEELVGTPFAQPFPTQSQISGRGTWEKILAGEVDVAGSERRVVGVNLDVEWVRVSVVAVRDEAGEFLYSIHTVEDITDRKAAESARETSDALWSQTFEQASVGIAIVGADRNIIQVNPALASMFGAGPSDLRGTWFGRFFPPPSMNRPGTSWDQLVAGGIASFVEERRVVQEGAKADWVSISTSAVLDEYGAFRYAVRMVQDITERKRAEQELQGSETQFRSLFEQAPFAIAMMDSESGFFAGNAAWEAMFGYSIEEMKGYRSTDFLSPNHVRLGRGNLGKVLAGELPFEEGEWLYRRKNGTEVWAAGRVSGVSDGQEGINYVLFMLEDITERKRAEQELQESQSQFFATIQQAPVGIAIVGLDRKILQVNPLFCELLGLKAEALVGQGFRSYFVAETAEQGTDAWSKLLAGEVDSYVQERTLIDPPPGVEWLSISTSMVRDDQGVALFGVRVASDITERRRAEQELRDSEVQFRSLFEAGSSGVALIARDRTIFRANPMLERFLGFPAEELEGTRMSRYFSPNGGPLPVREEIEAVMRGDIDSYTHDTLFVRKDGREVWGSTVVTPVHDSAGQVAFGMVILNDVTEQRQQQQELQDSETRLRAVFESGPFGLALIDEETQVIEVNQQLENMFGYSREEMLGSRLGAFNDPDYVATGRRESQQLVAGDVNRLVTSRRYQRKDGSTFPATVTTSAVRDEQGRFLYGIRAIEDVTERVRAEAALSESERRFRAIFEGAPLGIVLVSPVNPEIFEVNEEFVRMFGYPREALLGHRLREFWAEPPPPDEAAVSEELALGSRDRGAGVRVYQRRDGSSFHALATSAAIRDDEGNYLYGVRIVQDISEQVRSQEELLVSEARFRGVFESAPLPMLLIDAETHVLNVNHEAQSLFGYESAEMLGRPMREFSDTGEVRLDGMREAEMLITGEAEVLSSERIYRRKDGSTFPAQVSTAAVRDGEGAYRYSVRAIRDLTAEREVERGKDEFIAMTSHELRTPVTAMHAAVTLVASGVFGTMPERAQSMLDIAASNSDRLVALVNDLIDLERMNLGKMQISPQQINAGDTARQAADLVLPIANDAGVSVVVEPEDVTVVADPGRMLQTLQILLSNAIKFSPTDSTVILRVSHDDTRVAFHVADQGKGIPADRLESIFGRFQQVDSSDTRGAGGTGLGLAIAKSIVERHRGRIWAESELGVGSTFIVEIPTGQTWSPLVIDWVKGNQ